MPLTYLECCCNYLFIWGIIPRCSSCQPQLVRQPAVSETAQNQFGLADPQTSLLDAIDREITKTTSPHFENLYATELSEIIVQQLQKEHHQVSFIVNERQNSGSRVTSSGA